MSVTPGQTGQVLGTAGSPAVPGGDSWSKAMAELDALSALGDEWDGEGTSAPSAEVIRLASELLVHLRVLGHVPCPTAAAPGPTGTILLAWYQGERYFEIEMVSPDLATWHQSAPGTPSGGGRGVQEAVAALQSWSLR